MLYCTVVMRMIMIVYDYDFAVYDCVVLFCVVPQAKSQASLPSLPCIGEPGVSKTRTRTRRKKREWRDTATFRLARLCGMLCEREGKRKRIRPIVVNTFLFLFLVFGEERWYGVEWSGVDSRYDC